MYIYISEYIFTGCILFVPVLKELTNDLQLATISKLNLNQLKVLYVHTIFNTF